MGPEVGVSLSVLCPHRVSRSFSTPRHDSQSKGQGTENGCVPIPRFVFSVSQGRDGLETASTGRKKGSRVPRRISKPSENLLLVE